MAGAQDAVDAIAHHIHVLGALRLDAELHLVAPAFPMVWITSW
jgi:hypothetical protein